MKKTFSRRAVRPWLFKAGALAALALPLTACDGLLEVEDIDKVPSGALEGEAAIPLRVAGALSDFTFGFSGTSTTEGLIPAGGLFTDELYLSGTFPTRREIDLRRINNLSNGQILIPYQYLHRARIQAMALTELATEFDEANSPRLALGRNVEGYSEVLLGEHFCSGVPFSTPSGNEIENGEPLTTRQIFERALARFDAAIAGNPSAAQLNLARIGKGRTLLNLGRFNEAAAAVAEVPDNYVYLVQHSENTPGQNNALFALQDNGRLSLASEEGTTTMGVAFRSGDPRIPFVEDGVGFDGATPLYMQRLYTNFGADVPLASGLEARLIEIEALLNGGASNAYLTALNELRANYVHPTLGSMSMDALTDPGTAEGRVDQFFEERARFLYLTGHRLGDLRRLIRQYGRTEDGVFPNGAYHKGSNFTYGDQTAFPIPVEEENNPVFKEAVEGGCLPTEGF